MFDPIDELILEPENLTPAGLLTSTDRALAGLARDEDPLVIALKAFHRQIAAIDGGFHTSVGDPNERF